MRFRKDSPEECCPEVIMGDAENPRRWQEFGGLVCMRIAGHLGRHISLARDAAIADGVCHHCRAKLSDIDHRPDCRWVNPRGRAPTGADGAT